MQTTSKISNKKVFNPGILFILLSLIGVTVFFFIPFVDVFRRSFTTPTNNRFVGVNNYFNVINNDAFILAMKNTFLFQIICIPLLLIMSLLIALILYKNTKTNNLIRSFFLLPMAIPIASTVVLWQLIFDSSGFLNGFLDNLDIQGIDWMNTKYSFQILIFSYLWKNTGYNVILWVAALSTISQDLYEAAKIDGANSLKSFMYITLPNLKSSIFVVAVLALINSFKVFRETYMIAGDYPNKNIYLIQHLFNNWFRELSLDKIAPAAIINALILALFIIILYRLWGKKDTNE